MAASADDVELSTVKAISAEDAAELYGLHLMWKNVVFTVQAKDPALKGKAGPPVTKTILAGNRGQAAPGTLTGVFGPSGSGKTSLINILAGRRRGGVGGSFYVNGVEAGVECMAKYQSATGYVTQEDLLLSCLTVREVRAAPSPPRTTYSTARSPTPAFVCPDPHVFRGAAPGEPPHNAVRAQGDRGRRRAGDGPRRVRRLVHRDHGRGRYFRRREAAPPHRVRDPVQAPAPLPRRAHERPRLHHRPARGPDAPGHVRRPRRSGGRLLDPPASFLHPAALRHRDPSGRRPAAVHGARVASRRRRRSHQGRDPWVPRDQRVPDAPARGAGRLHAGPRERSRRARRDRRQARGGLPRHPRVRGVRGAAGELQEAPAPPHKGGVVGDVVPQAQLAARAHLPLQAQGAARGDDASAQQCLHAPHLRVHLLEDGQHRVGHGRSREVRVADRCTSAPAPAPAAAPTD